jgi:Holliday junction resolvase RusA-like endonuclease
MIEIIVDVRPRPQPRHRATRGGTMYLPTSAPVRKFKAAIQDAAKQQIRKKIAGGVSVSLAFCFARPKSHLLKSGDVRPGAKPFPGKNLGDLDNLEKGVWDSLTGIAFNDDSQIVRSSAFKGWAARDSVTIVLEEVA